MTLWQFFRELGSGEAGRWCRTCGEAIRRDDLFGASEGVCRPCRSTDA